MKTTSLEISKQLKETGYPQEDTSFAWAKNELNDMLYITATVADFEEVAASPTADEILEQLPKRLNSKNSSYYLTITANSDQKTWIVFYDDIDGHEIGREFGYSLADAVAKMWLYLKKEGLL